MEPGKTIEFNNGLIGCEDWRHFILLSVPDAGPVQMLLCQDDESIGFYVIDPYLLLEDYRLDMPAEAAASIGLDDWSKAAVFCTLVLAQEAPMVTANLLGPLVINQENGQAIQVILANSEYSARYIVAQGNAEGG